MTSTKISPKTQEVFLDAINTFLGHQKKNRKKCFTEHLWKLNEVRHATFKQRLLDCLTEDKGAIVQEYREKNVSAKLLHPTRQEGLHGRVGNRSTVDCREG